MTTLQMAILKWAAHNPVQQGESATERQKRAFEACAAEVIKCIHMPTALFRTFQVIFNRTLKKLLQDPTDLLTEDGKIRREYVDALHEDSLPRLFLSNEIRTRGIRNGILSLKQDARMKSKIYVDRNFAHLNANQRKEKYEEIASQWVGKISEELTYFIKSA